MHPHEAVLRRLFDAIAARDAEAAAACYHPDVFFTDPLYPGLHGDEVGDLWRMRLAPGPDRTLALREVAADDEGGRAEWTAGETVRGRRIAVRGRSLVAFRAGLVVRHYDAFPMWRWMAGAYGATGAAFGWFAFFKWAARREAARRLDAFRGDR